LFGRRLFGQPNLNVQTGAVAAKNELSHFVMLTP
jgi:hypothetical protein